MLIDTHSHLNFHAFEKDLDDVVRRAYDAGVEKIIVPGTDLVSSRAAVTIAQKYPHLYAAIGIHPHHAHDPKLQPDNNVRHELETLLRHPKVVAVGEIGLDYYRYTKTKYSNTSLTNEIKHKQHALLKMQLDLALIHNKPVILHCREAFDDMIQTISTYSRIPPTTNNYIKPHQDSVKTLRGVWHCFTGSTHNLQLILTMGYYIGFDGNSTYDKAQYSPLVAATPLNRLLLETDAPYLTPIPHRGTRNEPMYIPLIAQTISKYHKSPLSQVIHISTENAQQLFGL